MLINKNQEFYTHLLQITQLANIGPQDVPRTSRSNVPRTSPKDSFDRCGDVPILRPEMTSRGRLNLMFKGRPWEVDSGRPLVDLESTQTWISKIFLNFSFRTYSIDQI